MFLKLQIYHRLLTKRSQGDWILFKLTFSLCVTVFWGKGEVGRDGGREGGREGGRDALRNLGEVEFNKTQKGEANI